MPIGDSGIRALEDISSLKVILFLDCTASDGRVERMSGSDALIRARWRTRDKLLAADMRSVELAHYYRPIVEGWNDSEDQIESALQFGEPLGISLIGGIVPSRWMNRDAQRVGLSAVQQTNFDGRKIFPVGLENRTLETHRRLGLNSVLVKDQSCAVTILLSRFDRKIHPNVEAVKRYDEVLKRNRPSCLGQCTKEQLCSCERGEVVDSQEFLNILSELNLEDLNVGLSQDGRTIIASEQLRDRDRDRLIMRTRMPVVSRGV